MTVRITGNRGQEAVPVFASVASLALLWNTAALNQTTASIFAVGLAGSEVQLNLSCVGVTMREKTSTRGDDDTAEALRKLQALVPEPQEAHGLVMLLGNGIGEALTGVRARQASLELARATARGSASVDARRAEAEAARDAVTVVRSEVRRLRVTEPRSDERTVGVYGHVLDDGDTGRRAPRSRWSTATRRSPASTPTRRAPSR